MPEMNKHKLDHVKHLHWWKLAPKSLRITNSILLSHCIPIHTCASPLYSKVNADFSVSQGLTALLIDCGFFSFLLTGSFLFSTSSRKEMQQWTSNDSVQWNSSEFIQLLFPLLPQSFNWKEQRTMPTNSEALQPDSVKSGDMQSHCLMPWAGYRLPQKLTDIRCVATDPVTAC